MDVRTRFAPSPTGYLHIGGVRTALFNWLFSRRFGGQFILRIEDTDLERSTEESIAAILEGMAWLGLDYDEGPVYQTARFDRYRQIVQQLLDSGQAYRCYCTREELDALREQQMRDKQKPKYDGRYRDYDGPPRAGVDPVIRFKNPLSGEVVIDDLIRGRVVVRNEELDDLVIARADGSPTYNLSVVVDDLDMAITHVIRGDDHLNNTPRQINLIQALGKQPPRYAHVPMILGNDGKRLSKRHGAVSVTAYREMGILPQALLNYLARLGWAHSDQEIFSIEEMTALFDLDGVNKSAATFDHEKLFWLNQHYIKNTSAKEMLPHITPLFEQQYGPVDEAVVLSVIELYRDRARTLVEMVEQSTYLFHDFKQYEEKAARKNLRAQNLQTLQDMCSRMQVVDTWTAEQIEQTIQQYLDDTGMKLGKVAQPIRVAVTGTAMSPSIGATLAVLGKNRTIQRLQRAIEYIQQLESDVPDEA